MRSRPLRASCVPVRTMFEESNCLRVITTVHHLESHVLSAGFGRTCFTHVLCKHKHATLQVNFVCLIYHLMVLPSSFAP